MSNNTNTTQAPSGAPTGEVHIDSTNAPTINPTEQETTDAPSPILYQTEAPTNKIDVIRLPDYKSHDTVDGFFLGIGAFILLILLVLCLQRINSERRRMISGSD